MLTDTPHGIIFSGLTEKTKLSFISSNSSFSECVRKSTHSPYSSSSQSTNAPSCAASPYERCTFDSDNPIPSFSSSTVFNTSTFTGLTADDCGGAICFTSGNSLTLDQCIFNLCYTTDEFRDLNGGGAILINCGSFFSAHSSTFISCSTLSFGGAIVAEDGCQSSTVSFCTFIRCSARLGGGLMTFWGPTSALVSSHFISCTGTLTGGGLYHESLEESQNLFVSECVFKDNFADYTPDYYYDRGGGGFEDFKFSQTESHYSFSFFTGNVAKSMYGNDITVREYSLPQENITYCFTTTAEHSFWNAGKHETNWLFLWNTFVHK